MSILATSVRNIHLTVRQANYTRRTIRFCKSLSASNEEVPIKEVTDKKLGGFAQALHKFTTEPKIASTKEPESFATLLRNSNFIDLGDPQGKIVTGQIFHIVKNDLYIDFGWKFHCVCPRPTNKAEKYIRGAKVRLRIKDLEMSTKFLGSEKDLTILEADAILLGVLEK